MKWRPVGFIASTDNSPITRTAITSTRKTASANFLSAAAGGTLSKAERELGVLAGWQTGFFWLRCPQLQRPRGLEGSIQTQAPALDTAGITDDAHVGNFSGPRLAQLAPFIRSCFIGRISYLAPTSSRIMGSAAVRRSTSVWSFPEKIDSPHPPLGSSTGP